MQRTPRPIRPTTIQIQVLSLTAIDGPQQLPCGVDAGWVVVFFAEGLRLAGFDGGIAAVALAQREARALDPGAALYPGLGVGRNRGLQIRGGVVAAELDPGGAALVAPQRLFARDSRP